MDPNPIFGALLLGAIAAILIALRARAGLTKGSPPKLKLQGSSRPVAAADSTADDDDGEDEDAYSIAVVGESNYQPALRAIADKRQEYVTLHLTAKLVLENDNRFDSNAVRVDIQGKTVGYLSRADAIDYRASRPSPTATCQAKVCGGGPDKPFYGVWLDI